MDEMDEIGELDDIHMDSRTFSIPAPAPAGAV
jgi:hypothetical protein